MNNLWDILTMVGSLLLMILIVAAAYYGTRWYARRMGQAGAGKYIKVLERTVIATGTALAIVQVGERYYLLGVSDKSVRLISELPDFGRHVEEAPPQAPAAFSQMFRQLIDKTRDSGNSENDGDRP